MVSGIQAGLNWCEFLMDSEWIKARHCRAFYCLVAELLAQLPLCELAPAWIIQ